MGCAKTLPRFFWAMVIFHPQVFSLRLGLEKDESVVTDNRTREMEKIFNDKDLTDESFDLENRVDAVVTPKTLANCLLPYQGYEVSVGGVLVYSVCYDRITSSTVWSKDTLTRKSSTFERKTYFYVDSTVYIKNLPTFYELATEKTIFAKTFGVNTLNTNKADWFASTAKMLVIGHLSAYADMTTLDFAVATNRYINAAPQWQQFNNGNWKTQVEQNIQTLAQSIPLKVTTGTYSNLTINGKPYYLDGVANIKVPMYFWKLVCDSTGSNSIFFIGINFVYDATLISSTTNYNILVSDVCTSPIFSKTFAVGGASYPMTMDQQKSSDYTKGIVFMCERINVRGFSTNPC